MPYALAAYAAKNQDRILAQCPHASDVRGCNAWLKAGRVVRKGQKNLKVVAPVMRTSKRTPQAVTITAAYLFDVRQTDERTPPAAATA